ncbi:TPA: hypothetical protein ACQMT3_001534, partial [Streptococcus pyogenes]
NNIISITKDPFYYDEIYSGAVKELLAKCLSYVDYLKDLAKQSKTEPNFGENHKLYKTIMDEFKSQVKTLALKDKKMEYCSPHDKSIL